jgi:putative ABC transport system permease protein
MMRSTGLVLRLARRNLLRRPGHAVLLLVTLTVATLTLGTALAMQGLSDGGWERLWRATDGPHVTFISFQTTGDPGDARLTDLRGRAVEMAGSPEVAAVGGPWNHLLGHLQIPGGREDVTVEVRDPGRSPVDQPLVTDGHWLRHRGGVVLERSLADALDLGAGDTVTFSGGRFPIVGVARSVSAGTFPLNRPGQVWVDPETAAVMRDQGMGDDGFVLELRLDDPERAPAFAEAHADLAEADPDTAVLPLLETWQEDKAGSNPEIDLLAATLYGAGTLLALLAVATAAVLVADRMAAQTRQVGTLKAVGVTPGQVVLVLLAEHLAIAAVATALGLGLGRMAAPRLASSSVILLGDPELAPLTLGQVAVVAGVAAVTVVLGTVRPARRGIRDSTLRSLASEARPPRRPGGLARLVAEAGVPLPGVLGLRSAWRRPARLLTNAVGLALGVAVIVVALGLRASLDLLDHLPVEPGGSPLGDGTDALYDQVRTIVVATAALLLVLACINAFVVATFAARDSARNHAVLRAVGATPRQTTVALIVSQLGASALAVIVGIPLGLGLWGLIDGGDLPPVPVPAGSLALLALAVPLGFAALVAVPAHRLAHRAIAPVLAPE